MQRTIGSVFAGYRIDAVAGRGGMGVVYRATQLALGRPVALKLVAPGLAHEAAYRERFTRELQYVASIDHPNVIPVYHAGEEDGQLFVAMRWVEGTDLQALIARDGRLEPARTARIVDQVAAALDAAHSGGIVHRDVKPANVLLGEGPQDRVYLSDFGLSKHSTSAGGLTATGQWVGTPDYIAPEQIRGGSLDARCDVYSLGCVIFHTLTGSTPFPEEGDAAKLWGHMTEPPPSLLARIPSLPERLDDVVKRAMAKEPDDRYGSAGELGQAMLDAIEEERPPALDGDGGTELEGNLDWLGAGRTEVGEGPSGHTEIAGAAPTSGGGQAEIADTAPPTAGGHTEIAGEGAAPPTAGGHTEIAGAEAAPPTAGGHTEIAGAEAAPPTAGGHTEIAGADAGLTDVRDTPPPVAERPAAAAAPVADGGGRAPRVGTRSRGRLALIIAAVVGVLALGVGGFVLWDGGGGSEESSATSAIAVGENPTDIDFGEGAVWVANFAAGTVTRIDPATNRAVGGPIAVGEAPQGVSTGEGGVWVTNAFGTVTRIEPRSNEVSDDPIQLGTDPYALVAGGGSVWVANGLQGTVTRIDPEFGRVVGRPIRVGQTPAAVAVGEGSVWVANSDSDTVTRISERSGKVVGEPIAVGRRPAAVAVGEGAVWVANSEDNSVTRIEPDSGAVVGPVTPVGQGPVAITTGGGAVWVADSGSNQVTRIDR